MTEYKPGTRINLKKKARRDRATTAIYTAIGWILAIYGYFSLIEDLYK